MLRSGCLSLVRLRRRAQGGTASWEETATQKETRRESKKREVWLGRRPRRIGRLLGLQMGTDMHPSPAGDPLPPPYTLLSVKVASGSAAASREPLGTAGFGTHS
ncbi:hypothetical protein NQZ68_013817 [Dissostichus eleginoides]|nr:hypothetical protein NQZ68_013817 [Dissostichus eleginoides]